MMRMAIKLFLNKKLMKLQQKEIDRKLASYMTINHAVYEKGRLNWKKEPCTALSDLENYYRPIITEKEIENNEY